MIANELYQLVLKRFGRMTDWFSVVTRRKKTARNPHRIMMVCVPFIFRHFKHKFDLRLRAEYKVTMTEVRSIPGSGSGLFATKNYKIGQEIVKENSPLMKLTPLSLQQEERILSECNTIHNKVGQVTGQLKDDIPSLWESIHPPSTIAVDNHGKFKGMVQAALCYADSIADVSAETESKLLQLYHPSVSNNETDQRSEEEEAIVKLSATAIEYLTGLVNSKSKLAAGLADTETIQNVMLVWSCNSFEGGRVYFDISRINHSCNPNAVILHDSGSYQNTATTTKPNINDDNHDHDRQTVVAAADIAIGEEISISYLGIMLYTERSVRQASLRQNKHFVCHCSRCTGMPDTAAAFPCSVCHPRQRQLPEDVQYDDDADMCTVHYVTPSPRTNEDGSSLEVFQCANGMAPGHVALNDANKDFQNMLVINRAVKDKVATFLQDHQAIQNNNTTAAGDDGDDSDEEKEALQAELLEQNLGLASSVVGAKHWATNLVLMLHLERTLQSFHANMLTEGADPDMELLAEAIDMLERLCNFVQGLGLKLHMGHVLSDLIVGAARALVSLGDVKSQKYASEWLKRIAGGYVEHFESDGMQKVVSALQVAWTRQSGDKEEDTRDANKRARTS
jgi:hypothetical protein